MISTHVADSATPVANNLENSGRGAIALEGSPLAQLVRANIGASTYVEVHNSEVEVPLNRMIDDSRRKGSDGVVEHDLVMDEVVGEVSKIISANLDLARNVVMPVVKDLHEKYGQHLETLELDAKTPVVILPNVYHAIWGLPHLEGLVQRYDGAALNEYQFPVSLPMLNGEQIRQMLKTGVTVLDEVIGTWLADMAPEKPMDAYRKVFVERLTPVGRQTTAIHLTPNEMLDRNDLLLAFLISNGFEENMPDGVNISLDNLRLYMARMREQAGRAVAAELRRRENDNNANVMVYKVDHVWDEFVGAERVVRVNNDVYMKYLEAGGTPESIYGAVVREASTAYGRLLAEAEANTKVWERFQGIHNQKVAAQMFSIKRNAAQYVVAKHIVDADVETLPTSKSSMQDRLKVVLSNYQPANFADEYAMMRNLVCEVLFAHTNVRMVLNAMDTAEIDNPDLNPRELALYATIDLMARWMASQIELKYVN